MMEDSKDPRKWKSRKLQMALLALCLITVAFFAREGLASLEAIYSQYVAGVLGVLTLYLGGNVSNKYVVSKAQGKGDPDGSDGQ